MKIEIDQSAGFCSGVKKAIYKAEKEILQGKQVFCLGEMVHNEEEMKRLENMGLITISQSQFRNLENVSVLIRAHGEPPETYAHAKKANINLIEATCPVVIKLHEKIRRISTQEENSQIVIIGKADHPEILGLVGNSKQDVVIVNGEEELDKIDYSKPVNLFVQTTLNPGKLDHIKAGIIERFRKAGTDPANMTIHNKICGQVANRIPNLKSFCFKHDVVIFVSGKSSSNGKSLYSVCQAMNQNAHFISGIEQLEKGWFKNANSVGISGATSTPGWLLEKVAQKIKELI